MEKDNGIYKYMDCSTGHITLKDNEFLAAWDRDNPDHEPIIVIPHEYGYWMHCINDDRYMEENIATLSEPLKAVFRKAHKEGCTWINMDADGFEHDDLETFEW